MRTVADLMTRSPMVIDCDLSLADATTRMEQLGLRHLPVIGTRGLVGMVCERDVRRFLIEKPDVPADRVAVRDVMSADPYTVSPETPVAEVAFTLAERHIDAAVVMDGKRIAGMFTTTDALRALAETPADTGAVAIPRRRFRAANVLCPIDFSEGSREAVALAGDIAHASGGTVTLFHALDPPVGGFGEGTMLTPEMVERADKEVAAALENWRAECQRGGVETVSVAKGLGPAWPAITRYASSHPIDLIVIGTHGRTGIKRVLLGSVAENVARHAPCPVLIVRRAPEET